MLQRESIYAPLFERLSLVAGFKTKSRILRHWNDVPEREQPALFMACTYQRPSYQMGRPVEWRLGAQVYIYAHTDGRTPPGVVLNTLLDSVLGLFAFDNPMQNACTLGGLCLHAQPGDVETDEGTLGSQAVAQFPIDILVMGKPI